VTPFKPIPDSVPRFNGLVTKVRCRYRIPPSSFPGKRESIAVRARNHLITTFWEHPVDSRGRVRVHSHDRDDALWQSSPTPVPLNYSRHPVESFTQSFSYINATQRDWSAARSVSRASSRPFRHGRGGPREFFGNGGWGRHGTRGEESHAEAIVFRHAGPGVYRYPVDFALYRYDDDIIAPGDAHRVDLL